MIKSIALHNFQAHESTTIEFSSGVTVIVGTSDHGKSSIIRAINLVRNNRPLGTGIVRAVFDSRLGESVKQWPLEVVIVTEKHTIRRFRSKKENYYEVDDVRFEAVRQEVPEEVRTALGLADLNLQDQLLPHFLILDSPGNVAVIINKITHLDKVDAVVKELSRFITQKDGRAKTMGAEADLLRERLGASIFDSLGLFEQFLEVRRELLVDEEKKQTDITNLFALSKHLAIADSALERVQLFVARDFSVLDKAETLIADHKTTADKWEVLRLLISDWCIADQEADAVKKTLDSQTWLEAAELPLLKRERLADRFDVLGKVLLKLDTGITDLVRAEVGYKAAFDMLESLQDEVVHALDGIKNCPYCQAEFKNEEVKRQVIEELTK